MEKVEASRNFANKLWNASRFVLMNLDEDVVSKDFNLIDLKEEDKWIISRLNDAIKAVTHNLDKYEIGLAAQKIYDFIWDDYCDWYIEMVKSRLYGDDQASKELAQRVLLYVLKDINRLLHPFMPFITEEIWQHLPHEENALIISQWPVYKEEHRFEESEKTIEYVKSAIKAIRNARAEMNIGPFKKSKIIFVVENEAIKDLIIEGKRYFINLASAEDIEIVNNKEGLDGDYISVVLDKAEAFLPLKDLIDYDKEIERLEKEEERLQAELKRVRGKLSNQGFVSKAPEKVVNAERDKLKKYEEMMDKVLERLESLRRDK
jgi:valyl-tRNA synthetase